jgi:hypothetical protein
MNDEINVLQMVQRSQRALAQATTLQNVAAIDERAEQQRAAAHKARLPLAIVNAFTEIRLRAGRRAGELLRELSLTPGRPSARRAARDDTGRLAGLGINKHQSSRWQRLADIPENVFEAQIVQAGQTGGKLSMNIFLRLADQYRAAKRQGFSRRKTLELERPASSNVGRRQDRGRFEPFSVLKQHCRRLLDLIESLAEKRDRQFTAAQRRYAAQLLREMTEIFESQAVA